MSRSKIKKFAEMETLPNVFQLSYNDILNHGATFEMRGKWRENYFGNNNPIVLELGCGKGEYAVGLARRFPEKNFIGIDIKGSRMWTGAKEAFGAGLKNCAFLRTGINAIPHFFAPGEVDEIWITFADPQMKKTNKRLTSTTFLRLYQQIMKDGGIVNLKTDSDFLYEYTMMMAEASQLNIEVTTDDLYGADKDFGFVSEIQTYYESKWLQMGKKIKYMRFRLPVDVLLNEPDHEPDKDQYTSKDWER